MIASVLFGIEVGGPTVNDAFVLYRARPLTDSERRAGRVGLTLPDGSTIFVEWPVQKAG
jgi:hypothetical protein